MSTSEIPANLQYEHTNEEAIKFGGSVLNYIIEGDPYEIPVDFLGVTVFGVIKTLRENDELLYGEERDLSFDQSDRLAEVEKKLEISITNDLHYYPFGHNKGERKTVENIPPENEKTEASVDKPKSQMPKVPKKDKEEIGKSRKAVQRHKKRLNREYAESLTEKV